MKHTLKPLLFLLPVAAMIGCSKSNNSSPSSATSIVGKWSYSADTVKFYNNGTLDQTDTNGGVTSSDYFQFNANGTGEQVTSGGTTTFTYTASNGKLTLNAPAQTIGGQPEPASTEVATIKTLTSTDLFLYFDDTELNGGVTSETIESAHFKKQ
jgi:hypothetical protein